MQIPTWRPFHQLEVVEVFPSRFYATQIEFLGDRGLLVFLVSPLPELLLSWRPCLFCTGFVNGEGRCYVASTFQALREATHLGLS